MEKVLQVEPLQYTDVGVQAPWDQPGFSGARLAGTKNNVYPHPVVMPGSVLLLGS